MEVVMDLLKGVGVLLLLALALVLLACLVSEENQRKANNRAAYMKAHNCVRIGFTARTEDGIYQCDTGIYTYSELRLAP